MHERLQDPIVGLKVDLSERACPARDGQRIAVLPLLALDAPANGGPGSGWGFIPVGGWFQACAAPDPVSV